MIYKTFSIREDQFETLKKLSQKTGISQSFLIRLVIDELLKDEEKLKKAIFNRKEDIKGDR